MLWLAPHTYYYRRTAEAGLPAAGMVAGTLLRVASASAACCAGQPAAAGGPLAFTMTDDTCMRITLMGEARVF